MTAAELAGSPGTAGTARRNGDAGRATLWIEAATPVTALEREWEAFVDTATGGDVIQTAAWGRGKAAMGFRVGLAVARDPQGRIQGGGLVVAKRIGVLGGRVKLATVGYVARGPLVTGDHREADAYVLDALEATARELGVQHLIVQPPQGQDGLLAHLAERGYEPGALDVAPSCTLEIDLAADLETIRAATSSSLRRNIRKAEKLGVIVRRAEDADLPVFQALHAATANRQGFTPLSLAYLERQWHALRPLGAVEIFLAADPAAPERPIAGTWVTAYAGRMTDKIPGWSGEAPALQPNVACIWAAIAWAKEAGFGVFDLGGIDRASGAALIAGERGEGPEGSRNPAAFKMRFGGRVAMLPQAAHRSLNPLVWPLVRFTWRRLAGDPRLKRFLNGLRNG